MQVGPIGAGGVGRPMPVSRPDYSDPDPDIVEAMIKLVQKYRQAKDIEGTEGEVKAGFLYKEKGGKHIYNFTARYANRSTALDRKVLDDVLKKFSDSNQYGLKAYVRFESLTSPDAEIVVERAGKKVK